MIKIHMLIEEEYIEEFMKMLPKDKVKIIEENFEENRKVLNNTLEAYLENKVELIPYSESMKNTTSWLESREVQ